jgi:hypothetical protein
MSEATSNVEFAHKIHEQGHHHSLPTDGRAQWVETVEATVLAIVAVATAWSGYQASKVPFRPSSTTLHREHGGSAREGDASGAGPPLRHDHLQYLARRKDGQQ